jgi:hypothetical protein
MPLKLSSLGATAVLVALLVAGCASPGDFALFKSSDANEKASLAAPAGEDRCPTPEKCAKELRKMINDPTREWIGQPQSPDGYANGTRLFAYRALRKKLTCNELKRALEDMNAATSLLQPAQYDQARALTVAVAREIKAEQGRRCGTPG